MIVPLEKNDFARFFTYLDRHMQENGKNGTPLFQPAPRNTSEYPLAKQAAFIEGLAIPVGHPHWRRAWIALDKDGQIGGHLDLRARPEPCTQHRALLGIGVCRDQRRNGTGTRLLEFCFDWACQTGLLEIIDLNVMAANAPAIGLYKKAGFVSLCEIDDMFRIEGRAEADIMMAKKLYAER